MRETGKPDPKTGNMLCPACSPRTWEASSVGSTGHPTLLTNSRNKREKQNKKCPNCQTTTTSLWRKFKTADEVKKTIQKKKPSVSIDRSRPEIEGQLGCNACTLYWSLHGVSLFIKPVWLQADRVSTGCYFVFLLISGKSRVLTRVD